jgi:multidrug efflux pump subunit AcrA (membrane-fusion protein)
MVAAEAPADYAKLLFRTEPFSKMASARRFQLLSQARSVQFFTGHHVFPKGQPPSEVLLLLGGKVRMLAEIPGTDGLVLLGEYGPGCCVGWDVALADVCGVQAIAEGEVVGLMVAAPSFIEIARFDAALRQSFLHRPSLGEVWWAVLSELQRRDLPVSDARRIVEQIAPICITRDWPDEEAAIESKSNYLWSVSGGEGIFPGTPWVDSTGVLWARLTGIPSEQFERVLFGGKLEEHESEPKVQSAVRPAPEKSHVLSESGASEEKSPAGGGVFRRVIKSAVYFSMMVAAIAAGVCGWASRQPTFDTVYADGKLRFSGDVHPLSATLDGRLVDFRLKAGERVEKGAVLAVIQPPKDEAKAKMLAETLARARQQTELCERILRGVPMLASEVPPQIAAPVRDLNLLKSELRIKRAINLGRTDDPAMTADERAKVTAHFETLKADRAARVDAAQSDSAIRREDLADAEEALREAKDELRLQVEAAASLGSERGDEAKLEAASAQRAIAVYRRTVSQRQETVNRLKKSISAIRVAPASEPVAQAAIPLDKLEASIREADKAIRKYSASNSILAVETELALEQIEADAAPRQISATQAGLITEVASFSLNSEVKTDSVLGKFVTRQAWEIECPDEPTRYFKPGQDIKIITIADRGAPMPITAQFSTRLQGEKKNIVRICHDATDDTWREGTTVKIEARVVTGNLLDRWLLQIGIIQPQGGTFR